MMMKYTDRTGAIAGKATNLWDKAKGWGKGAVFAKGDQYWKSANTNVTSNLKAQHANFVEKHKAHAREWASALDNLVQDLKAAKRALKAAGEDTKKRDAAETKEKKALEKMDRWLASHDNNPRGKVAQMFKFMLGGLDAADRLNKLEKAVGDAKAALATTYATKTESAVKDAQGYIEKAVKDAVSAGWKAEKLADRNTYKL